MSLAEDHDDVVRLCELDGAAYDAAVAAVDPVKVADGQGARARHAGVALQEGQRVPLLRRFGISADAVLGAVEERAAFARFGAGRG